MVIVTGHPGAGKTTLGTWMAERLDLPYFFKDGIKEVLYETFGWSDTELSRRLGAASYEILFHILEAEVKAGRDLIVEANYDPSNATPRFLGLERNYHVRFIQVHCVVDAEVALDRVRRRGFSTERHPGHIVTPPLLEELRQRFAGGRTCRLALPGPLFEIDGNHPELVDREGLAHTIQVLLSEASAK